MLAMIFAMVLLYGIFRLFGFSLKAFGWIIGLMIGGVFLFALIGGLFAMIGTLIGLAFHIIPVLALIGLGVFIGQRVIGSDRFASLHRSGDITR